MTGETRQEDTEQVLAEVRALLAAGAPMDAAKRLAALPMGEGAAFLDRSDLNARALAAAGQSEAADRLLARALTRAPLAARLWMTRLDIALSAEEWSRAEALFADLPDRFAREAGFERRRARYLAGRGQISEAISVLEAQCASGPPNTGFHIDLARLCEAAGRHPEADRCYRAALEAEPANRAALLGRIGVAMAMGDLGGAVRLAEKAETHLGDDPVLAARHARALLGAGRAVSALRRLARVPLAAGVAPDFALLDARVAALLVLGDWVEAEAVIAKFLEHDPAHVGAWQRLVDTALAQGDPDRAMALCTSARDATGDAPALRLREVILLQGVMRHRDALDLMDRLPEAERDRPAVLLWRGHACAALGDADAARKAYRRALALDPTLRAAREALEGHEEPEDPS